MKIILDIYDINFAPALMRNTYACLALLLLVQPLAAQTALTFTPQAALPDGGRYGMAYCQDQTAFYMIGGGSPATAFTSEVFRYDPVANSWGTGALSTGQVTPHRLGTAALIAPSTGSAVIYTLNGAASTGPVTAVQAVQASSGALANTYGNPTPASSAGLAVWNGLLYAYGGQLQGGVYTNALRSYNPATNAWATLAPMAETKTTYGAAVNGKIYAIGGFNGTTNSARVDAYDIATNTWQALGTLPTTVSNEAVAVQGEWLWLVGDFTNQSYLAAYNTRTGQLRTFTSNLPPRRNAAAAIFNNRLYVWGGNMAASNASTLGDMWSVNVSTVLATHAETAAAVGLRAFPNPSAAGLTTLTLPTGTRTVEVFDALGRAVLSVAPAADVTSVPLDLRGQSAGLYVVRVHMADGRGASCRVVRE
jgi:N-acetylneuraminic acid mutarotase